MKYTNAVFCWAILAILLSGCWDESFDCERGRGEVVSEMIEVSAFSGVRLRIDAEVFLTQGSEHEVILKGQLNMLDELEIYVQNDILIIDTDQCLRDHRQIRIYITMPEIIELGISGSGNIFGENVFTSSHLNLSISGSGDMDLEVDVDELKTVISGSGDIYLTGLCKDLDFRVSGSGDLHGFELLAGRANIDINGSGDAEVSVLDFLDIRIQGSGNVYFKGSPEISSHVSGSGNIVDAN